ncbi:MAG: TIGR00341 family protein [Balneolaceae bacterium]|nr:TIGR00341 family protein [Balneolaceae bacterium]
MLYRLIEVTAPKERLKEAENLIPEENILHLWADHTEDGIGVLRVLMPMEHTEQVMDEMADKFESDEEFRLMVFDVEATLPRPETREEEEGAGEEEDEDEDENKQASSERISREELYADIEDASRFTRTYAITITLSVLVACVGLINNNVAVIIGAMVIAPLLGPNVALALASTLGDLEMAWSSFKTAAGGLIIGLVLSYVIGMFVDVDPEIAEISSRTVVGMGDLVVALAAGSAGVLAFTRGISAAIIGVMVAVALLPPLANLGLLLGSGYYTLAFGAFVLVIVNVICINLAGVVTFLVQGIRPRKWWEEKKAKRATRIAITIWMGLLLLFLLVILYWW